jgi:hypothetical protein
MRERRFRRRSAVHRRHPRPGPHPAVSHGRRSGALERSLFDLAEAQRAAAHRLAEARARAVQDERLRRLEQDVTEVRTRLGGLIFLVIGALITQVVIRMLG